MEEVGQLVMKMSQAGQQGDIFKLFAEHITELIPGLTHIRYAHCLDKHACIKCKVTCSVNRL